MFPKIFPMKIAHEHGHPGYSSSSARAADSKAGSAACSASSASAWLVARVDPTRSTSPLWRWGWYYDDIYDIKKGLYKGFVRIPILGYKKGIIVFWNFQKCHWRLRLYFQDFQCILNDSLEELGNPTLFFFWSRFPSASNSRKFPASFQRLQTEVSTAHGTCRVGHGLLFLNDHRVLLDLFCSCTRLSCLSTCLKDSAVSTSSNPHSKHKKWLSKVWRLENVPPRRWVCSLRSRKVSRCF